MPYIDGETLRHRLLRERQLPVQEAVRIVQEIAEGLGHAHRQGLIHRDIKPENILLSGGHAVIADFGIARAIADSPDGRLTDTGMAIGTPQYMSPEQASGDRDLDQRTDLYSLGCILFELLTGEPPFGGPSAAAVTAKKLSAPMPSIRMVRETVPEDVERVAWKALARAPADRYRTAAALVDDLVAAAGQARAPTPPGDSRPDRDPARAGREPVDRRADARARGPGADGGHGLGCGAPARRPAGPHRLGRGAAAGEPDARRRPGLLRRGHASGADRESVADSIAAGDLADLGHGVQGNDALRPGHRREARRGWHLRGIGAPVGRPGEDYRDADSGPPRARAVDQDLRSRDVGRPGRASRGGADGRPAVGGHAGPIRYAATAHASTPGECAGAGGLLQGPLPLGAADPAGGRAGHQRSSSRRFRPTRPTPRRSPVWPTATSCCPGSAATRGPRRRRIAEPSRRRCEPCNWTAPWPRPTRRSASSTGDTTGTGPAPSGSSGSALALNPSAAEAEHWYALFLATRGRQAEAIAAMGRAATLDPLSLLISVNTGWVLYLGRQYEAAVREETSTARLWPSFGPVHYHLGLAYEQMNRYPDAIAELERARALSGDLPYLLGALGHAYAMAGRGDDARRLLADAGGEPRPCSLPRGLDLHRPGRQDARPGLAGEGLRSA